MVGQSQLQELLDRLSEAAEQSWPTFRVERSVFQERLLAAVDLEADDALDALDALHAPDLYLAVACAASLGPALSEFAARYLSRVDAHLGRLRNAPIRPEDVRRDLEDTMLFGREGGVARIGQYTGRGPLDRFVGAAARNIAFSMLRKKTKEDSGDWDALASRLSAPPHGESTVARASYGDAIREALLNALGRLDRRQRTIVRLHLLKGVPLTQVGRMLRVHQSTVSRDFAAAMRVLYAEIRRQFRDLHGVRETEMKSIIRDVRSQLDLSLARVLRDTTGEG
jgi:RNA polymerase sigma-70 factor (ECF subfamily)